MKKFLSFFLALALCLGLAVPAAAAADFTDVPTTHWAYKQIMRAAEDGAVEGTTGGKYEPSLAISAAQFITVLTRVFYADEMAASTVGSKPWYAKSIAVAINDDRDLFEGANIIDISADMNRFQMAVIMYNVLADKNMPLPSAADRAAILSTIPDKQNIPADYQTAVTTVYGLGLITGAGTNGKDGFCGTLVMDRAQMAVVYCRMVDLFASTEPETPAPETPKDPTPVVPDPTPTTPSGPVTPNEVPEFRLLPGENVQQMMDRVNAGTPAYRPGYLTNGKPITEENIQEMLELVKEGFPDGTAWTADYFYDYRGKVWQGGGCNGFAYAVSDFIFGEDAPFTGHRNYEDIKVGDVIWCQNSATGYNHVVVITAVDKSYTGTMYYPDPTPVRGLMRSVSGNSNKVVSWNGIGFISDMLVEPAASESAIYSRY